MTLPLPPDAPAFPPGPCPDCGTRHDAALPTAPLRCLPCFLAHLAAARPPLPAAA